MGGLLHSDSIGDIMEELDNGKNIKPIIQIAPAPVEQYIEKKAQVEVKPLSKHQSAAEKKAALIAISIKEEVDEELLEEKKDEVQPIIGSQRYNKTRKLDQISNEVQDNPQEQKQSNKRRKVVDEPGSNENSQLGASSLQAGRVKRGASVVSKKTVILVGGKAKEDKYKKLIGQLGGKAIEDLDEDFDVYITDDKLVRNSKLLLAIARGASIVNVKWLEDS